MSSSQEASIVRTHATGDSYSNLHELDSVPGAPGTVTVAGNGGEPSVEPVQPTQNDGQSHARPDEEEIIGPGRQYRVPCSVACVGKCCAGCLAIGTVTAIAAIAATRHK